MYPHPLDTSGRLKAPRGSPIADEGLEGRAVADDIRTGLRCALDDLNAGLTALFGLRSAKADLVSELLSGADPDPLQRTRLEARPRSQPRRPRPHRLRRRGAPHLALVK
jgi:hypothetical protein